jgi:hypothetical protein
LAGPAHRGHPGCRLLVRDPRIGERRTELITFATAMTVFAAGDVYYVMSVSQNTDVPFPSPADVAFIIFYPLSLVSIALAVRRELRQIGVGVWLDCLSARITHRRAETRYVLRLPDGQ